MSFLAVHVQPNPADSLLRSLACTCHARHTDSSAGEGEMSSQVESASHSAFSASSNQTMGRTVPIIQASGPSSAHAPGDPMEVVSNSTATQNGMPSMGPPPARTSPDSSVNGANTSNDQVQAISNTAPASEQNQNGNMLAPGSAGAAQSSNGPPKPVQQTAFIHKLYK